MPGPGSPPSPSYPETTDPHRRELRPDDQILHNNRYQISRKPRGSNTPTGLCPKIPQKLTKSGANPLSSPPLGPLFASTRQHNSTQQSARNTKSINIVRHSLRAPKYGTENQDFKSAKILAICYPTRCPDHSEENQTTGHPTSTSRKLSVVISPDTSFYPPPTGQTSTQTLRTPRCPWHGHLALMISPIQLTHQIHNNTYLRELDWENGREQIYDQFYNTYSYHCVTHLYNSNYWLILIKITYI